jgi:hypothetical protein
LENLDDDDDDDNDDVDISMAWESIGQHVKDSATDSLGYYDMK